MAIKHAKVSALSDDPVAVAAGDVVPSDWNTDHTIEDSTITEAKLLIADNTTNDVSTTAHGFAPKLPNDATKFLNGAGAYAVPAAAPGGANTQVQFNDGGAIGGDADFTWDKTNNVLTIGGDALIKRRAAATWQLGGADSATPTAQTLAAQGSRGGTDTNVAAVAMTIQGSLGTGTGTVGGVVIQTGTVAASGSTQHTAATRLTINSGGATFTVPVVVGNGTTSATTFNAGTANTGFIWVSGIAPAFVYNGGEKVRFNTSAGLGIVSTCLYGFSSNATDASIIDSGLSRIAAQVVGVGNGTAGSVAGDVKSRNVLVAGTNGSYVQTPSMTVANLAVAATAGNGAHAYVTDSTLAFNGTNLGTAVTGGGANHNPVVVVNGAWVIG